MSRTNTDLDRPSKDSEKVNMVPENQSADKKGLRASLRGVKTGSNPSTITALAENRF